MSAEVGSVVAWKLHRILAVSLCRTATEPSTHHTTSLVEVSITIPQHKIFFLTVMGRSFLSQVIYLRVNSRIVKPLSSSPSTKIQSCCSSTAGVLLEVANRSYIICTKEQLVGKKKQRLHLTLYVAVCRQAEK